MKNFIEFSLSSITIINNEMKNSTLKSSEIFHLFAIFSSLAKNYTHDGSFHEKVKKEVFFCKIPVFRLFFQQARDDSHYINLSNCCMQQRRINTFD